MRELWVTFGFKLFGILAYKLMNSVLVLWLSSELHLKDGIAGLWVTMWSTVMTLFAVLVGSLTDAIGLRKAFLLGIWFCLIARIVMTFTTTPIIALLFGLLPLALGEALGTPVMTAAVQRYSKPFQRPVAFSFYYALMNVGFYVAARIIDEVRRVFGEQGDITIYGYHFTTYRALFLGSVAFELVLLPLIYFGIRRGAEATETGMRIVPEKARYTGVNALEGMYLGIRDAVRETGRISAGLFHQPGFYKFLGFLGFASMVRMIFVHQTYTYPKFAIRELGEGMPIMTIDGLNSILIIFLVPLVGAICTRVPAYTMVLSGSAVAAASVFFMVMPTHWFQPLADGWLGYVLVTKWLGVAGPVNPWWIAIFFYIVFLSLGEAFYSPRLYEYAAAVAPRGQEASYMSLSYVPFFLAKLLVGTCSGFLLEWFCPSSGPRHSQILWLVIALTTAIAPMGLLLFRRQLRADDQDPAARPAH